MAGNTTADKKRVWMLLIPKERNAQYLPPRVFCKKSLDLLDNKGVEFFGDDKEPITDSGGKTYDFWVWRHLNAADGGKNGLRRARRDRD